MKPMTLLTFISSVMGINGISLHDTSVYNETKGKHFFHLAGMFGGNIPIQLTDKVAETEFKLTSPESVYNIEESPDGEIQEIAGRVFVMCEEIPPVEDGDENKFVLVAMTQDEYNEVNKAA